MKKFLALYFNWLPNAAHYNYFKHARTVFNSADTVVKTVLADLLPPLNDWQEKEELLMEWVRKSELTAKIAEADQRLDHALVGLSSQVRALEYSADTDIAAAAHRTYLMLKSYGRVTKKTYEAQSGDVQAILLQFDGGYAEDATTLGLADWIAAVQGAFTEFQDLLSQRDAKSIEKPAEGFPVVRRGLEDVYHQIVTVVDANVVTGTPVTQAAFISVIDLLNPEIERLNAEYHRARRNIATAEPEPIPPQGYVDGQPVTPTPAVFYTTPHDGTVKLELGKDYNLTYKNNKKVGNAQCTIHGKGLYTGSKTVTFIIEHKK
jgi:hypothetical protein